MFMRLDLLLSQEVRLKEVIVVFQQSVTNISLILLSAPASIQILGPLPKIRIRILSTGIRMSDSKLEILNQLSLVDEKCS